MRGFGDGLDGQRGRARVRMGAPAPDGAGNRQGNRPAQIVVTEPCGREGDGRGVSGAARVRPASTWID